MAITDIIEESSMIETGAPSIKYEGERPLKKQEMLMAGPDWYIKRMELLMDEYGYDYDEAGEIAYDSDKYYEVIGIDPGGIGDESRNMDQGIPNTKTIKNQPHMLAYITPGEADTLKDLGGQEAMTEEGIPSYYNPNEDRARETAANRQRSQTFDAKPSRGRQDQMGSGYYDTPKGKQQLADQRQRINEMREKGQGIFKDDQAKIQKDIEKQKEIQKKIAKDVNLKQLLKKENLKKKVNLDLLTDEDEEEKALSYVAGPTKIEKDQFNLDNFDKNKDGKLGFIEQMNAYQNKKNVELANKRALQKYQDIEQYVSPIDEYGITGAEAAAKVAADPTYGYDFSDLETGKSQLGSNIGTSIESYRPNLYDVNSPAPGLMGAISDKIRPDTQVTAENTLKKARDYRDLAGTGVVTREDLETLRNRGKTDDQINPRDNEPSQDPCKGPNPPAYCFVGGKNQKDEEEVVEEEWMMPLAFRAEGGRVGRAYGGIMDKYTGRRAYGLGSIFKKAKKIFKSPLGKAALLGLGGYKMGLFGSGGLGGMLSGIKSKGLGKYLSGLSTGKVAGAIGGISLATALLSPPVDEDNDGYDDKTGFSVEEWRKKGAQGSQDVPLAFRAEGGDAESGLMDLGGMEKDYREDGGFVPIGGREKADDVPARLSKNEFVFTADAVRNAGGGDVDKGAEVMYNVMKNLEGGGDVLEETQGLDRARQMFQTSQRLEEVL